MTDMTARQKAAKEVLRQASELLADGNVDEAKAVLHRHRAEIERTAASRTEKPAAAE